MLGRSTPRIHARLNRNAKVVLIGAVFLFFSVLIYISLCAMPCEYAHIDERLEQVGHVPHFQESHGYAARKQYNAFVIVMIITGPKYFERRDTIRETWMSGLPKEIMLRFVIGTAGLTAEEIDTLEYENSLHNDLLLLPKFNDTYHNLTSKLIESFKWFDRHVNFQYLFKADDDTFARMDIIVKELEVKRTERLFWGFFDGRARVKKSGQWAEHKWILCDTYLPHARGGGYILTADLVRYVSKNADFLQKFNSEDVSLGAWLGPLDIERIHDSRFDTEYMSRGCMNAYIVTHKQDVQQMRDKFESLKESGNLCRKEFRTRYSYEYNWRVPPSMCCLRNDTKVP